MWNLKLRVETHVNQYCQETQIERSVVFQEPMSRRTWRTLIHVDCPFIKNPDSFICTGTCFDTMINKVPLLATTSVFVELVSTWNHWQMSWPRTLFISSLRLSCALFQALACLDRTTNVLRVIRLIRSLPCCQGLQDPDPISVNTKAQSIVKSNQEFRVVPPESLPRLWSGREITDS